MGHHTLSIEWSLKRIKFVVFYSKTFHIRKYFMKKLSFFYGFEDIT